MQQHTVSIIIPVYNAERTIARCLESILADIGDESEIIVIDDGSSDGSLGRVESFCERYPGKIRVFSQENRGVAETRNAGIGYAKSEYVMFVDHDDSIDAGYVSAYVSVADRTGADIVMGGYRRVSDVGRTMYRMELSDAPWSRYLVMAPWAKMYRRSFIVSNGISFLDNGIGEDVYFNLWAIAVAHRISILQNTGYNWHYDAQSVSNASQRIMRDDVGVERLLKACFAKLSELGKIHDSMTEFYFIRYVVWYLLFAGRRTEWRRASIEAERLFEWLSEHFPAWKENQHVGLLRRPVGEPFWNTVALAVVVMFYRFGWLSIFFWLYARRDINGR